MTQWGKAGDFTATSNSLVQITTSFSTVQRTYQGSLCCNVLHLFTALHRSQVQARTFLPETERKRSTQPHLLQRIRNSVCLNSDMGHLLSILITFRLFEKRNQQLTPSLPIIFYTIFQAKGIATVKRGKNTTASLEEQTVTEQKRRARRLPTVPAYPLTTKSLSGLDSHQGISNGGDPHRFCTKPVFSAWPPSVWRGSWVNCFTSPWITH